MLAEYSSQYKKISEQSKMTWWDKFQKSVGDYIQANPNSNACNLTWGLAYEIANYVQTPTTANSNEVLKVLQQMCKESGASDCTPDANGFEDFLKKNENPMGMWAVDQFKQCASSPSPSPSPSPPAPPTPAPLNPMPKPSVPTQSTGLPSWMIWAIVLFFFGGTILVVLLNED